MKIQMKIQMHGLGVVPTILLTIKVVIKVKYKNCKLG